jgi:hypothetical protein
MARSVLAIPAMQNNTVEMQMPQCPAKNPLESLMLQQLQQLITGEKVLRQRYARLGASADSNDEIAQFKAEMLQLETRADRLYRMMNAMTGNAFA